jgi:hypothetical protein
MDRHTNVDQERVEYWRQNEHAQASDPINEDDDLPDPLDRRNREHVAMYKDPQSGEWLPTLLKRDDDVMAGGVPLRVVGPGRDRRQFLGFYNEWFGPDFLFPIDASAVTERAPADPSEQDMPIIPPAPNDPSATMMAARAVSSEGEQSQDQRTSKGRDKQSEAAAFEAMIAPLPPDVQRFVRQAVQKHRKDT